MIGEASSALTRELEDRLRFETLMADLSLRFVNVPADRVDQQIEDAQRAICECLGLDHSSLWQASTEDPGQLVLTHLYRDPELPPPPQRMTGSEFFPWAQAKLIAGEIISVPNTSEAPPEAARDMETWGHFGVRSTVELPFSMGGGALFGVLSFDATRELRACPEPLLKRLQLIAQLFANALDRKRAEQKLRDSETRLNLAAASANAGLWTLEPETGHVWATPKAYELFALPPSEEIDLDSFLAIVHLEDREMVGQVITEAMQSGKESAVEYRIVHPNANTNPSNARIRRGRTLCAVRGAFAFGMDTDRSSCRRKLDSGQWSSNGRLGITGQVYTPSASQSILLLILLWEPQHVRSRCQSSVAGLRAATRFRPWR